MLRRNLNQLKTGYDLPEDIKYGTAKFSTDQTNGVDLQMLHNNYTHDHTHF